MQRLVLILTAGLVVLALYAFQRGGQPDPNLINLAVRATVYAMPSPSPQVIEVTRVVEVTRMVEVVRLVEVTPTPLPGTPTPTVTPTPLAVMPSADEVPAADVALFASSAPPPVDPEPIAAAISEAEPAALAASITDSECPVSSSRQYTSVPVTGAHSDHPDSQHGDLNLALRGFEPTDAGLSLIDISGPADGDAPQLAGVFGRFPAFGRVYRARDWNWACGEAGCRGEVLGNVEVSLLALESSPGEEVKVPSRSSEIYGGGFVALVLYADVSRLTVVYTREDSVANGYTVHLEDFCVDPNLLARYQSDNGGGRGNLPAIRNGEAVGTSHYNQVVVGIRDRGSFTDPRSRKDWWRGY